MNHTSAVALRAGITLVIIVGAILVGKAIYHPADKPAVATPTSRSSSTPIASATPSPTSSATVTLTFGGDIMLGRTVETRIKQYGGAWPLSKLGATMAKSDITVANLESPLRQDAPSTAIGSLVLRGDPDGIASLKEAGIDVVSLANNHIPDMGLSGLQQTEKLLTDNSIAFAGAGESDQQAAQPVVLTRNGIRFGFLSYTYGVNFDSPGVHYNLTNPTQVTRDVTALKSKVDMVIILAHFGVEYHQTENQDQIQFAHSAIDAGASLVIGAHPHIDEPMEQYKNGLIFYSLGNLVFDQEPGEGRDYSALVSITTKGSKVASLSLLPYKIYNFGQPALLTSPAEQQQVWQRFNLPGGSLTLSANPSE